MGKLKIKVGISRNGLQIFSGITIIILTFIANGFLSFIKVGFDFSKIWTSEFWANFLLLFLSEMMVLYGMFIIQKVKDLKESKITDLQMHINEKRKVVYGVDKITDAENWLKEIYNYREKLYLYEEKIKKVHAKIVIEEPKKDCKNYEKKLLKYNKLKNIKDLCLKQFEFIKKDKERLKIVINEYKNKPINDVEKQKLEEIEKSLKSDDYEFLNSKIKYKEVYFGNLISDNEENEAKNTSPFFSEKRELAKNMLIYFAFGLIITGFLTSLTYPAFKGWSIATVLNMLLTALTLIIFMIRGISLSHRIILGTYYKALEKRKSIYNQMLKDLGISKIIIEDDEGEKIE